MKLLFISLGCDKNLVDSEHMLAMLAKDGFTMTDDEQEAEVIVVNSCCFISDAMEESIQTLIDMGQYKQNGCLKALIVTGCLAQRYADDIAEQIPEVDAILGTMMPLCRRFMRRWQGRSHPSKNRWWGSLRIMQVGH